MVRGRTGGEPSTSRRQFYIGTRLVKFPMKKIRRKKPRGEIFDGKLPMCQCTYETAIYGPHSIALCCMGSGKKFGTKWLCYCPLIISIMQLFGDFETTLKLPLCIDLTDENVILFYVSSFSINVSMYYIKIMVTPMIQLLSCSIILTH